MSRNKLIIILAVMSCAVGAYGDFYPIICIGGCGDMSPALTRGLEAGKMQYSTGSHAIDVENVRVVSQDLKMVFRAPDRIEVSSDYILDVSEDNVAVDVRYFFGTCRYYAGGERFIKAIDDFQVELGGERIDPEKIRYFGIDPKPGKGGEYTAVFPFEFRRAGRYEVELSYSQEVPGGFLGIRDAGDSRGCSYGFSYDISPLRYWAGGVEDVSVELVVDGLDITDFGRIYPSDFVFTKNGCMWEWHDITDDMLSGPFDVEIYFGLAGRLGANFAEVLREGGIYIYQYPDSKSEVIAKLAKGDRVYLYAQKGEDGLSDPMIEWGWRKCRLLDNREGYVITWLPEYFFDSSERRKIMRSYPRIYGENP